MCVSTCTCMCESVCVYVCMHVCVSVAMCAFMCECVPECMSVSVSICACVQVFSCPGPSWNVQGLEGVLSLSLPQPSFFHPRFVTGVAPGMRRRTLRMRGSDKHGLPSSALPQFPQLRAQSLLAQNRQILSPNPHALQRFCAQDDSICEAIRETSQGHPQTWTHHQGGREQAAP